MAVNPNTEREILQGNNTFVWDGEDNYPISQITNAVITQVIGVGQAATLLPNGNWVGSLNNLSAGQEYTFGAIEDFTWSYPANPNVVVNQQQEPTVDFDSLHPLDFNQDGYVNIIDAQIAAQQYGQVTAEMVVRYTQNTEGVGVSSPYDINGDGIVDLSDIQLAIQGNVPQHIIQYMTEMVMNPPAPTQEYDPTPPVAEDGSAYHPLDGNEDGNVDVMDLVYWTSQSNLSLIAKTTICGMVQRYMDSICPYDVTQDGQVSILDITHCAQNGVPENIIQDILANIGADVPMPQAPEPTPPTPAPTPFTVTNNLWMPEGNYMLLSGTPYFGPVHKHHNNLNTFYMTEYIHKNHSRLLIPAVENPAEAITELPNGGLVSIPNSPTEEVTPAIMQGITDVNGDNITNILDLIAAINALQGGGNNIFLGNNLVQTNGEQSSPPPQTGGGTPPPPQTGGGTNQQNNSGGGNSGGGGGGAY